MHRYSKIPTLLLLLAGLAICSSKLLAHTAFHKAGPQEKGLLDQQPNQRGPCITAKRCPPVPLVTIPIEIRTNRVHLNVTINGNAISLLLDTGASVSLLFEGSAPFINDLATTEGGLVSFPAKDQSIASKQLMPTTIAFGELQVTLKKIRLIAQESWRNSSFFFGFDGIVGQELFQQYTVEISPRSKTLALYKKGTDLSSLYRSRHTLYMKGTAPHIRFRSQLPWEKSPRMKELLVDTGYPGAMVIWNAQHFKRATTPTEWEKYTKSNTGIIARSQFSLGQIRFIGVPVFLAANPPIQVEERDGIIGGNILNNYQYAIDFNTKRMWLYSRSIRGSFTSTIDATLYPPNDEDYIVKDFRDKIQPFAITVLNGAKKN